MPLVEDFVVNLKQDFCFGKAVFPPDWTTHSNGRYWPFAAVDQMAEFDPKLPSRYSA
jgi:hypothetical protein